MDADIRKSIVFAGQRIPTMYEVLTLLSSASYQVLWNVVIKDYVSLMTINPGFAGQKLIPQTLKKLPVWRTQEAG